MIKLPIIVMVVCVSFTYSDNSNETVHIRVKRGKYYSSAPQRFYRRPPNTYPVKGPFSYTPPPGYMMDDEDPPYPGRPKVSRRPNDGLGDEDINNIVKYLSKQDLDKIIEFAGEKERIRDNYIEKKPFKREESKYMNAHTQDIPDAVFSQNGYRNHNSDQKFNLNGPYRTPEHDSPPPHSFKDDPSYVLHHSGQRYNSHFKPHENDQKIFNGPYAHNQDSLNYVEDTTPSNLIYVNHDHGYSSAPLQTEESMVNKQVSYINSYIHHEINGMSPGSGPANIFTDNQIMKEEELPRPVNLRADDFEISYTNKVQAVVKGPSYEVKNFGELPLMSNNYKLDTVSSYKVPHYTVTSNSKYGAPSPSSPSSSSLNVPLEPAPPKSEAKEQSDAHLKAIKIWTHRSKGTAYTLHNDGTLSLEFPSRPKTKYGP